MRAFLCPTCDAVMLGAKGPWDIWYCLPCKYQWDVYAPNGIEPKKIEVSAVTEHDVWGGVDIVSAFMSDDKINLPWWKKMWFKMSRLRPTR